MDKKKIISTGCSSCRMEDGKYKCSDVEESIKCFWATNITQQPDKFDFKNNFEDIKFAIRNKLTEHGLRGVEDYREYMEGLYGTEPTFEELQVTPHGGFVYIGADELRDLVYEHIVDRLNVVFGDVPEFEEMRKVLSQINNLQLDGWSNKKKTELFDRAIHLQHVSGEVVDIDIERLREDFDKEVMRFLE